MKLLNELFRTAASPFMQYRKCPVCATSGTRYESDYQSDKSLFSSLGILTCTGCGLGYVTRDISEAELESYNKAFFDNAAGGLTFTEEQQNWLSGVARLRWEYIQHSHKTPWAPSRILEVGPGVGFFPDAVKSVGLNFDYMGIETDNQCRSILDEKGWATKQSIQDLDEKYDFFVMSHVLEHISDPLKYLKMIEGYLMPGSLVYLEVPCRDYLFKDCVEPHLLFFHRESMQKLFQALDWEEVSVDYFGRTIDELKVNRGRMGASKKTAWNLSLDWASEGQVDIISKVSGHICQSEPSNWVRAIARTR